MLSRLPAPAALVPVAKPKLPAADRLLPYLREIDASRTYTNHGPLSRRLEAALAEHTGAPSPEHVCVAANATAALTAVLSALGAERSSACMMPAWTFAATAHAVMNAGLVPWLVDVDPAEGALLPDAARAYAAAAPVKLGAVLAVSPFGLPVAAEGWRAFREQTGIPVAIDAAAAFDTTVASAVPTVVSLHATKVLGAGEGAFAVWNDRAGVRAIRQRINFGFAGSREARVPAANAKMSEYAAAVALAALDDWPAARAAYRRVALAYARALDHASGVRLQSGYGARWVSATTIVRVLGGRRDAVERALAAGGVSTLRWWGEGVAAQAAFAASPRTALPVTTVLASSTLGLPCWPDLPDEEIARIAAIVARTSASRSAYAGVPLGKSGP
ncbi:MAG TPA: DegT/DnrJ/EryC1/StrS family aminotransferase [Candidatus Elarobacter sp.]|nr:DegT/DnrJ/EryC1/StrS family aminotransferase [Candidatus Elarobacter sp.]